MLFFAKKILKTEYQLQLSHGNYSRGKCRIIPQQKHNISHKISHQVSEVTAQV